MDLSKRDTPLRSQPQTTFRRETTMPRQATDLPGLEVNAAIHRPDMSGAEQLSRLLGLATDTAQKIAGDIQDTHDKRDQADAVLDFSTNHKNDERFAKSRAYRDAWQLQGAKKLAIDISTEVTEKFNTALNDPDHPATLQDLDHLFEESLKGHLMDEQGKPLDFITPEAKLALGNSLAQLKAQLMPQAAKAIKEQQDTKLFATTFHNMLFERDAGQEIGAPPVAAEVKPEPKVAPYYIPPIPKGWKGNAEDAIRELGMSPEEATQFVKTGKDPRPKQAAAPVSRGSLIEPFKGFTNTRPSSTMGAAREGGSKHNGEDFPVPLGTKLKAPMAGEVIAAFSNERGGNQVRVKMADGAIIGYAHLSEINVRKGDQVAAGEVVGLSGNTGHTTGPHVHMTLEKGGQKVSVRQYFRTATTELASGPVIEDGSEPQLAAAPAAPAALKPGFNVEGFMATLPPSVDKGQAKTWLIDSLIAEASSKNDPSLLNGLEDATRKDGTPSFTPTERLKIAETRDRLTDRVRIDAERVEKKLQEDNADKVLEAFASDRPPSKSWLAEQGRKGLLDDRFVIGMIDHIDAEERRTASEARAEARMDQAEVDNDLDAMVYGMEAERRAGILKGSSYDEDLARWKNGELGEGKKAAARFKRLVAATRTGQSATEQNPSFAFYSSQLKTNFAPPKMRTGIPMVLAPKAVISEPTYRAMVALYEQKVHAGEKPEDAYAEAVRQYGAKKPANPTAELSAIRQQIADLRRKRGGG